MILELKQTGRGFCTAGFAIKRLTEETGTVSLSGKPWSMEAYISGIYRGMEFEMLPDRHSAAGKKRFRPYRIRQDGRETGSVYQTIHKDSMCRSSGYHRMEKDGMIYSMYPVGFGIEGSRCPVYCGDRQTAQAEKDGTVHNDMHYYRILATDENAAFTTVLFCMYMYVNACYKPGKRAALSEVKTVSVTTDRFLKEKYNPDFRERITD